MLDLFKKFFKREPPPPTYKEDYRIFHMGGVWGYHIEFWDKPSSAGMSTIQSVWGHYTPTPSDGDILEMDMKSGKITLWVFYNCRYPGNPDDMFFADISFLGYKDEISIPASSAPKDWDLL